MDTVVVLQRHIEVWLAPFDIFEVGQFVGYTFDGRPLWATHLARHGEEVACFVGEQEEDVMTVPVLLSAGISDEFILQSYKKYKIKPLEWTKTAHGDWTADTIIGEFFLDKNGKTWSHHNGWNDNYHSEVVEDAKKEAEAYYLKRLMPALEV